VIADEMLTASTARRPRARYAAPRSARVMLYVMRFLSDRVNDAVIRTAIRRA
jgi:hypothetical protein